MKFLEKVYVPCTVKEASKLGVALIATHKVTVVAEKVKLEFIPSYHLKEQSQMVLMDRETCIHLLSSTKLTSKEKTFLKKLQNA